MGIWYGNVNFVIFKGVFIMGIIIVLGILMFFFVDKKDLSFGEWLRQLHILLRLGIFTAIIGFILGLISKLEKYTTVYSDGSTTSSIDSVLTIVQVSGQGLLLIAFLCFFLYLVIFLKELLFGKQ